MHILFIVRFDPFKCSSDTEIFVGKRAYVLQTSSSMEEELFSTESVESKQWLI
jgi:hypothetical protein